MSSLPPFSAAFTCYFDFYWIISPNKIVQVVFNEMSSRIYENTDEVWGYIVMISSRRFFNVFITGLSGAISKQIITSFISFIMYFNHSNTCEFLSYCFLNSGYFITFPTHLGRSKFSFELSWAPNCSLSMMKSTSKMCFGSVISKIIKMILLIVFSISELFYSFISSKSMRKKAKVLTRLSK